MIPHHIAIIPDGNRRWAKERGLSTLEGHKKGLEVAIMAAKKIRSLGVSTLTMWAFSTENWKRDNEEVSYLMDLYATFIDSHLKEVAGEGTKVTFLGRRDRISDKLRKKIENIEEKSKHFTQNYVNIALDYGGQDEVLRAVQALGQKIKNGDIDPLTITPEAIANHLDTANQPYPNPDIIIRTSGEHRTSGLLIWQAAYAEYFFLDKYFPDLTEQDLEDILAQYEERERRFGR